MSTLHRSSTSSGLLPRTLPVLLALAGCVSDPAPASEGGSGSESGSTGGTTPEDGTADGSSSGAPQDDGGALELSAEFLGGAPSLLGLATLQITESGSRFIEDEGLTPGEVVPASDFARTLSYDLEADQLRIDVERTLRFLLLDGIEQQFPLVIDGLVGAIGTGQSALGGLGGDLPSDRVAATQREQLLLNPHLLVRAALADPTIAREQGPQMLDGREYRVLEIDDAVAPIELLVDAQTGSIDQLRTMGNGYLRRDVTIEVDYAQWQPAEGEGQGGLLFPMQLDDPQRPVHVHHISQQEQAVDLVLVDVEQGDQRFVFVADLYGPGIGSIVVRGIEDFLAGMVQHQLLDAACTPTRPTTIVGAHGGAQSFEDMLGFVGQLGVDLSAFGC